MKQTKVAIIGCRHYKNYPKFLEKLLEVLPIFTTEIVSGGANGVDKMAERYAKSRGLPIKIYLPQYKLEGRSAPLKRNERIAKNCDVMIAFWDGKSRGTINAIQHATILDKKVKIVSIMGGE